MPAKKKVEATFCAVDKRIAMMSIYLIGHVKHINRIVRRFLRFAEPNESMAAKHSCKTQSAPDTGPEKTPLWIF